jgi:hypothetical protein
MSVPSCLGICSAPMLLRKGQDSDRRRNEKTHWQNRTFTVEQEHVHAYVLRTSFLQLLGLVSGYVKYERRPDYFLKIRL